MKMLTLTRKPANGAGLSEHDQRLLWRIAALLLEASDADITYAAGSFGVVGTDRRIALTELATHATELKRNGTIEEDLDTNVTTDTPLTFPNGVHIAEVEIDPETGRMEVVAYSAVDDCGNVLDGMIVEGQLHGGIVQGIGQALYENCVYDSASGQLLSGSFMDYCMPRAENLPTLRVSTHSTPSAHTPMGVKGCGEVGTIGSPAAITNAVVDALSHYGVSHIDMPTTPNRIWSVIPKRSATSAP